MSNVIFVVKKEKYYIQHMENQLKKKLKFIPVEENVLILKGKQQI